MKVCPVGLVQSVFMTSETWKMLLKSAGYFLSLLILRVKVSIQISNIFQQLQNKGILMNLLWRNVFF